MSNCPCETHVHSNETELMLTRLKRAIEELSYDTTTKMLVQDQKISELCVYIKNNLSNELRLLFDSMETSGKIDKIISEFISGGAKINPSNDQTGLLDQETIQAELDRTNSAQLSEGEFYIKESILMRSGQRLFGQGLNTIVHVIGNKPFIKGNENGFDHIMIKDLQIINDSPNENIAIDLTGNDKEPYNGARYSHFSGIRINGFRAGIQLKGLWSSVFERIRTLKCTYGVLGLGCMNNLSFDQCEFTQGTTGVKLTCDGSTENYGIRINNCNFEGNSTVCIDATGCIKLSVNDIYSEKTPKLFAINSCPQFSMNGGHVSGVSETNTIVSTAYTTELFVNPKAAIKNLNIECTINEEKALLYIDGGITNCEVSGNRITNKGTGKVKLLSNFNGIVHKKCRLFTENQRVRYSSDYKKYLCPDINTNEVWRVSTLKMKLSGACAPTTTTRYTIRFVYEDGTYEDVGNTGNLTSGNHNTGETLSTSFTTRPELKEAVHVWLIPSTDCGAEATFDISFDYIVWNTGF